MPSNPKLTRSEHVASLALPPGRVARTLAYLRRGDVLLRITLCLVAALLIWAVTSAWAPPLGYRVGYWPLRDITARVPFTVPDPQGTEQLREQRRSEVTCIYAHDDRRLKELQSALKNSLFQLLGAKSVEELDKTSWDLFLTSDDQKNPLTAEEAYSVLHETLANDMDLTHFAEAVQRSFQTFEEDGLFDGPTHAPEDGSQISIQVHPLGKPGFLHRVEVKDVRIAEVTGELKKRLVRELQLAKLGDDRVADVAQLVFNWLTNQGLPTTLTLDEPATQQEYDKIERTVSVFTTIAAGDKLADGNKPLAPEALDLLRREYRVYTASRSITEALGYSVANWGMFFALCVLCGCYIHRHQPDILQHLRRLTTLLTVVVLTVAAGRICAGNLWKAEIIPVLLFAMTMVIAYSRDLALLLSAAVILVLCVSLGFSLAEFTLMVATVSAAILLLNRVRSRTKLIYVGLGAGLAALLTTLGIGTLGGQPLGSWGGAGLLPLADAAHPSNSFLVCLITGAVWHGFCALLAALIMTGLLPFIERLFEVQTDISLLELGDAAHPLLQELARRAPGTYNHSINVASLAEAAAESVGANGLLVRVGAYFHDIGKVFKPGYFVENQGRDVNRHESLLPAMSTLVIIAHVKDGADLARQNRLPQTIIDFIEQHHGTTLVEYFYQQAARQSAGNPDGEEVEEASYRYPGPKPQSREAAVLMLADAVESASRTLVEPTPARIESLIQEISLKRLLDGQFDECGITQRELSTIEDSLVKALTAVYHARVKYPDQQTA